MDIEPRSTVIAVAKCNGCGSAVEVKTNRNRIAYYFCPCAHHEKWSRANSDMMAAAYRASAKETPKDGPLQTSQAPETGTEHDAPEDDGWDVYGAATR